MKVLIIGAGGQVGRALIASVPPDYNPIAVDRSMLDISNADAVSKFVATTQPGLIVNAAAYTAVDRAEHERDIAARTNEAGARNLARSASAAGARMLHISTDFVFDGNSSVPYRPDAAAAPLSAYGETKLAGDRAVTAALPHRSIVLRTSWVYSAHGRNFVRTMLRLMKERHSVRVVADQIGTPTSASSVAEAVWALVRTDAAGIYHWADGGVASWYDFAVAIADEALSTGHLTKPPEVLAIATDEYAALARRPRFSVLDKRTTIAATGLVPRHWRENLRCVLRDIPLG